MQLHNLYEIYSITFFASYRHIAHAGRSMGENAGTLAPRPKLPASWLSAASGSWDATQGGTAATAAVAGRNPPRGVSGGEVGGSEGRRVILSGTSGGAVSVEVGPPHVVVELAFTNSVRFLQPGLLLQVRTAG